MDWIMMFNLRKTLLLLGLTISVMFCLALLVAVDKIAPALGYGAIMFLGALWLPSPLHSQDAEECILSLAHSTLLIPKARAEGVYPISEVKDVTAK